MQHKSVIILGGVLLICLSAYVSVHLPISEKGIPFTAQSLVIFIVAGFTKPKEFLIIIITYLLLGLLGCPVFADGSSGWDKLLGASGGFLYGFIFSGLGISYLLRTAKDVDFMTIIVAMLTGTLVLFVFGLGQLAYKFGWPKALEYGLYPFWFMALVKAIMASMVVFFLKRRDNHGL